jgi:uncharacterized coiled-coil DUF342 family protein
VTKDAEQALLQELDDLRQWRAEMLQRLEQLLDYVSDIQKELNEYVENQTYDVKGKR